MKTWFPVHRLVSSSRFVWYHPRLDRPVNKGTLYSKPKSIPPFSPTITKFMMLVCLGYVDGGLSAATRHSGHGAWTVYQELDIIHG